MTRRTSTLLTAALTALAAACSVRIPPASSPPIAGPTASATARASAAAASAVPVSPLVPTPPPAGGGLTAELVCEEPGCGLSLLDADGEVMPGWPVELDGFCSGAVTDGIQRVYAACDISVEGPTLHGFNASGAVADGWPVILPAPIGTVSVNDFTAVCGRQLPPISLGADGTLYVSTWDESVRLLHAIDPAGQPRAGWPQPLPGDNQFGCGGFTLLPDQTLRAWGYEGEPSVPIELGYGPFAQRTVFTALAADGSTLPGWPFGSTGTGSGALIGADGTLYHVSEAGNVWAHGMDGQPKPGWPFALGEEWMSPYLAPDGRLVLLSATGTGEIVAIGPDGATSPGWPRRLLVGRASPCLYNGDTDCFFLVEPVFGPDGTVYLALAPIAEGLGGSILALGPDGLVPAGWPLQLPDAVGAVGLAVDGAGHVIVHTATCTSEPCWETAVYDSLTISGAGQVIEGRP